MELYHGRPADAGGRLPKEMAVYDLLDDLGIEYDRVDHEALMTVAECDEVDHTLNIQICKNLFLCNSRKTEYYLLLMPGKKKFVTKEVSRQISSSRLSFADEGHMEEFLDITPGSVSIMGLMNDTENHVNLLIDQDVLQSDYLGCHPCINTSSLKLRTKDVLEKFLPCVHHPYRVVEL